MIPRQHFPAGNSAFVHSLCTVCSSGSFILTERHKNSKIMKKPIIIRRRARTAAQDVLKDMGRAMREEDYV